MQRSVRAFAACTLALLLPSLWLGVNAETLKFCRLRSALSVGQAEYVAGLSLYGDSFSRFVSYRGADDVTFTTMKACALEVRQRLCTDSLLMSLIDPAGAARGAAVGGAGGKLLDSPTLGTLLGSATGGMVGGVYKLSKCAKDLNETYVPILQKVGPRALPVDLTNVGYATFVAEIRAAMGARRITPDEAGTLLSITDKIAGAARSAN